MLLQKKDYSLNFVNFFFDAATPLTFTCSESAIETMGKREICSKLK